MQKLRITKWQIDSSEPDRKLFGSRHHLPKTDLREMFPKFSDAIALKKFDLEQV